MMSFIMVCAFLNVTLLKLVALGDHLKVISGGRRGRRRKPEYSERNPHCWSWCHLPSALKRELNQTHFTAVVSRECFNLYATGRPFFLPTWKSVFLSLCVYLSAYLTAFLTFWQKSIYTRWLDYYTPAADVVWNVAQHWLAGWPA